MRLTATEKYEIIQQVTRSELGVKRTLEEYGIARSVNLQQKVDSLDT